MNGRFVKSLLFGLAAFACTAGPAVAQGFGGIGGTVGDASGAVLPGVNITLTSTQGTVGANQTTITDDRGAYQFSRLVPGTYIVKAELQGFRPAEQRNIVVNADQTSRADLKLEIGTMQEGVTVTGEAPLLDTTSALKQTVISNEVLQALPNRVDMWAITKVVPSIVLDKVDVGGSEAFIQSRATVHGSSQESGYYIDGLDVSSLDGNQTGATFYMDPFAYQETNYQVGGAGLAATSRGGLIYNGISRTGTNQFHGGYIFSGMSRGMQWHNFTPDLRTQVLAAIPPKVIAVNPNIQPFSDFLTNYDTGAWIGGPILKDKLWFTATEHYQVLNQYPLGGYDPDGRQVVDDNRMNNSTEKIAWQVTRSAQLSWFNDLHYKGVYHRNGTGTNVTTFSDSAAKTRNTKWPDVHEVKFTTPLGTKMVVDVAWGRQRGDDFFGQESQVTAGTISHFDTTLNTYTLAWPTYNDNKQFRDQVFSSFSYFAGHHDIRFGFQFTHGGEHSNIWSTSGMRAVYANGLPTSVNTYTVPITSTSGNIPVGWEERDRETGTYIQDQWTPIRQLVINAGVRFATNRGWELAACRAANIFVTAQCYPRIDNAPNFKSTVPRVSVVYDVTGDGKTALKFGANRYDQPIGLAIVGRLNPVSAASDTRTWLDQSKCASVNNVGCDLNGDGIPQPNELGPSNGYGGGVSSRYAPGLKWPLADEYSAEIQRQLPQNLVATVGFTHRVTKQNTVQQNVAVPSSGYIPLTVTEVVSGQTVTVYNQSTATRAQVDTVFFNDPRGNTTYNGWDLTVNKRMQNHWSLLGGASFGKTTGDVLGGDLNNPNSAQYRLGNVGNDIPWSYRMSGVYETFYGISLSGTYQYNKGQPDLTTVLVTSASVPGGLTQGSQSIVVEPRATRRLPNVAQLDFTVRKIFRVQGKTFTPRADFYNLTNESAVTAWITQLGPTYHRASTIQHGRVMKLGVNVDF
jgi:Carboxypeptidase regulatory-like domain